ncbi:hypothetical protein [uncultured Fusobacterium sp.]|uniref:hypothetical protein n=1 Tax=uncultured Fusobacterium sp. TaxID=159267 RepID=UPI0025F770B7|nr:hypothetical protein [uncultured Fusobacterium sp.]
MNNLKSFDIFEIIDRDIRLNYKSKSEFARKIKVSRSRLDTILKTMQQKDNLCRGIAFNTLSDILEKAGYKIKIEKLL